MLSRPERPSRYRLIGDRRRGGRAQPVPACACSWTANADRSGRHLVRVGTAVCIFVNEKIESTWGMCIPFGGDRELGTTSLRSVQGNKCCRIASATACVRLLAPSFSLALRRCVRMVSSPSLRAAAIALMSLPAAAICSTARSRAVSCARTGNRPGSGPSRASMRISRNRTP